MTIKKIIRETTVFVISATITCVIALSLFYVVRHSGGGVKAGSQLGMVASIILSVLSMAIAFLLQTLLHEGGHLVCGLLTGFRFLSFRILRWAIVKDEEGRLALKSFNIPGTIGQCLLVPPKTEDKLSIPYFWYNAGGVLFNFLTTVITFIIMVCVKTDVCIFIFLLINCFVGGILVLMNGIPKNVGGLYNDGKNIQNFYKYPELRKYFYNQLAINALLTYGKRMCEMPEDLFPPVENKDYGNTILLTAELFNISRTEDCDDIPAAYGMMKAIVCQEQQLPKILLYDIKAEYMMLALLTGNISEAETLFDNKLEKYMKATSDFFAAKIPPLYAWELIVRHDAQKAQSIRIRMEDNADKYLYPGEVRMATALLEYIDTHTEDDRLSF